MKSKFLLCASGALLGALALMIISEPTALCIGIVSMLCVIGYASIGLGIKYYNALLNQLYSHRSRH